MAQQRKNPGPLDDFEHALASLTPTRSGLNRDRLMYVAGQTSVAGRTGPPHGAGWWWPASTALSTAAALWMGLLLFSTSDRSPMGPVASDVPSAGRTQDQDTGQSDATSPGDLPPSRVSPSHVLPPTVVARDEPSAAATDADSRQHWVRFLQTRRTALRLGIDAIAKPKLPDDHGTVVASTYWEESKRLLPRTVAQETSDNEEGSLPSWRDLLMTGDHS
jgi:hypothetical protein